MSYAHTVADLSWHPFENGRTLGQPGSERGTIVRDEEHSLGARISLERAASAAPFAITCGVYGWMLHTRFFRSEEEAGTEYGLMKNSLASLLEAADQTAAIDGGRKALMDGVGNFIKTYP